MLAGRCVTNREVTNKLEGDAMAIEIIEGAGIEATARWTAAVRAQERARDDALFIDPWAAALAGEEGTA